MENEPVKNQWDSIYLLLTVGMIIFLMAAFWIGTDTQKKVDQLTIDELVEQNNLYKLDGNLTYQSYLLKTSKDLSNEEFAIYQANYYKNYYTIMFRYNDTNLSAKLKKLDTCIIEINSKETLEGVDEECFTIVDQIGQRWFDIRTKDYQ